MKRRFEFTGILTTETGLHIGSGQGDFTTDACFVRTGAGQPYIPGSSFKGALRSTVERMSASLPGRLRTCLLDASGPGDRNCPTVHKGWQAAFSQERERGLNEDGIAAWLYGGAGGRFSHVTLCDTCRLFGSPYVASKVSMHDLYLTTTTHTEVRHGVGIDRDTGTARAQIKFDYETLPAQVPFDFKLVVEELDEREEARGLGLLCCGLREFERGRVALGGNRSRGLGACRLQLTQITESELGDAGAWLDRLLGAPTPRGVHMHIGQAVDRFGDARIQALFEAMGV
jgi:CRISPR-associated RAMP protein (TIGR02581 family)